MSQDREQASQGELLVAGPRNYSECKTDMQMLLFAQNRLWEILEEHRDPDSRANGYVALGVLVGMANKGIR